MIWFLCIHELFFKMVIDMIMNVAVFFSVVVETKKKGAYF